jgi:hypothetical protein
MVTGIGPSYLSSTINGVCQTSTAYCGYSYSSCMWTWCGAMPHYGSPSATPSRTPTRHCGYAGCTTATPSPYYYSDDDPYGYGGGVGNVNAQTYVGNANMTAGIVSGVFVLVSAAATQFVVSACRRRKGSGGRNANAVSDAAPTDNPYRGQVSFKLDGLP